MNKWEDEAFGNYIAGLIDGEGSFVITKQKKPYLTRSGYSIQPYFVIGLKNTDKAILEKVVKYIGVGKIYEYPWKESMGNRTPSVRLHITGKKCLILIEFLDKFLLRAKKLEDYKIWKEFVKLYTSNGNKCHNNPYKLNELEKLEELRIELITNRK